MPTRSPTASLLRALPLLVLAASLACAHASQTSASPPVRRPPAPTTSTPARAPAPPDEAKPPDRDEDRLADAEDECPELPETYNGYEDEDGCPDELPGDTTICSGPPLRSVSFAKGGVALATEQRDRLDETVEVLKRFPDLRVELRGHTDSRGTPSSNRGLATRRAEAVARYLVEAGVEQHRVETLGVGEVEPIATNDTRAGRAKNRRVEFWIIPQ